MSETLNNNKVITKQELAERLGISARTRQRYMNKLFYPELVKLGYQKKSNIVNAAVVKFMVTELTDTEI